MQRILKTLNPIWPISAADAINLQQRLCTTVRIRNDFKFLRLIAGADDSYDMKSNFSHAFIVLMDIDELRALKFVNAQLETRFPYVPGLLSFREIPVILEALQKLDETPDLLMVDGQGIAHPRRLGIAAHLGVLTDLP